MLQPLVLSLSLARTSLHALLLLSLSFFYLTVIYHLYVLQFLSLKLFLPSLLLSSPIFLFISFVQCVPFILSLSWSYSSSYFGLILKIHIFSMPTIYHLYVLHVQVLVLFSWTYTKIVSIKLHVHCLQRTKRKESFLASLVI